MTDNHASVSASSSTSPGPNPGPGSGPDSKGSSRGNWVPRIPAPLQRLFDAVPLVTYPPNELPCRSPSVTDLPILHVFISEEDAARGSPSFNPSCLKWQTFLRIAGVQFHLRPSTNHASPTGALPYLQPPTPSISTINTAQTTTTTTASTSNPANNTNNNTNNNNYNNHHPRLEPRTLQPIPSHRLEAYAAHHGALPPASLTPEAPTPQLQSQARRRQAYQALLDGPVRDAWLYALYLSPPNERVLRRWYVDPVSRSAPVRDTVLRQLRAAVRAEIAKSSSSSSSSSAGSSSITTSAPEGEQEKEKDKKKGEKTGWSLSGNFGDALTWALGGGVVIDPSRVYAEAARAFEALETLLYREAEEAGAGGVPRVWFFGSPHPTLFDAAVFSYVYLILYGDGGSGSASASASASKPWADDTLRQILVGKCRRLVGHTQRVLDEYWTDQVGHGWVELS